MAGRRAGGGRQGAHPARLHAVPSTASSAQQIVHVGQVIRAHRERAGLTQEQAAVRASLTRNTVVALERARFPDPHLSTLLALMAVYGVGSLDELLGSMPSRALADAWAAEGWVGGRPATSRH
jgi:DNA-binding XRE family transcriptional regulator